MINTILKLNGARFYEVHAATTVKNPTTGAKGKAYQYLTQVFAFIQSTSSLRNIQGLTLQPTADAGDLKTAEYIMYSKEERFEKERILCRGNFYEIRNVDNPDNGILSYFRSFLTKVDNQPTRVNNND